MGRYVLFVISNPIILTSVLLLWTDGTGRMHTGVRWGRSPPPENKSANVLKCVCCQLRNVYVANVCVVNVKLDNMFGRPSRVRLTLLMHVRSLFISRCFAPPLCFLMSPCMFLCVLIWPSPPVIKHPTCAKRQSIWKDITVFFGGRFWRVCVWCLAGV